MRELNKEEWSEFHQHLVNEIAEFLSQFELSNPWIFELRIDDIPNLVKYKKWTPYNDSYMGLLDKNNNEIIYEI